MAWDLSRQRRAGASRPAPAATSRLGSRTPTISPPCRTRRRSSSPRRPPTARSELGPLAGFVYGVSPLPAVQKDVTQLPAGGNNVGCLVRSRPAGFPDRSVRRRLLARARRATRSSSLDYSHYRGNKGWRTLNINPLLPDPNNPAGARIRPLAADLQRVYGDPRLLGITNIVALGQPQPLRRDDCRTSRSASRRRRRCAPTTCWDSRAAWAGRPTAARVAASPAPQTPLGHRRRHLRALGMGLYAVRRAASRDAERRAAAAVQVRGVTLAGAGLGAALQSEPHPEPERRRQPAPARVRPTATPTWDSAPVRCRAR